MMISSSSVVVTPGPASFASHQLASLSDHREDEQTIPASAFLTLPPFPPKPLDIHMIPFCSWQSSGVWLVGNTVEDEDDATLDSAKNSVSSSNVSHDAHGVPMTILDSLPQEDDLATLEAKAKARRSKVANSRLATRVEKEDCWKIGDEGIAWEEPEGTSRSTYDM